jgi:DNA polymerase
MPVDPLQQDLPGGRVAIFHPGGKDFPDRVRLEVRDQAGPVRVLSKFNPSSKTASRDLENEFLINETLAREILATYWTWAHDVREQVAKEEAEVPTKVPLPDFPTPYYGLRQRTKHQRKDEANSYDAVNSATGFLAVLKRTGLPDDTLLEWDKDKIEFCCVLDLDFHDPEAPAKPTPDELDELGRELSPAPEAWWLSQGGGLKALYTSTPNRLFTAQEFATGAAAKLLTTFIVMKCHGTIEIDTKTRHPGAKQNGKQCGRVNLTIPDEKFDALARFSAAEATEVEVTDFLEDQGLTIGEMLGHDMCLIDPKHPSKSNPVYVGKDGLFCHSCAGRFGRGFMSWGYVRRYFGLGNAGDRSLSPIGEAVKFFTHVSHVDYLFKQLLPVLPEALRRTLYRTLLKSTHQRDPRISVAMGDFFFVRGLGTWLHADTLLPVGRPLNSTDVSILPSCLRFNPYDAEKPLSVSSAAVASHTNNGRIHGWVPIQPYIFEPIFFKHNEAAAVQDVVRCYPRVRTTRDRVTYTNPKERLSLEECERRIEEYFPGVNLTYIKALIIAAGCAESGKGAIPMLWATGETGSAKTTTITIVQEMYGESYANLSEVEDDDRLVQLFGESLESTRLITFDDFAKEASSHKRFHTFLIRLNRHGHSYHKLFVGKQTPPVNSAVILTDWSIPRFFAVDPQFGRRVHLITLESRIKVSWEKIGHFVEGWWKKTPELTAAANGLHSWVVDEFFPAEDEETFSNKMERLDIFPLEDEVAVGEGQVAMQELIVQLVNAIATTPPYDEVASMQRRIGKGIRHINWRKGSVGTLCTTLVDSLGKVDRDEEKIYNVENLKHVLDPFQLKLAALFDVRSDVSSIAFDLKVWGSAAFIRLVEAGKSFRAKDRRINEELFRDWPPKPTIDVPAVVTTEPMATLPGLPAAPPIPTVEGEVVSDDVVILDPFVVYLDFETQSECNIKQFGSTVYAQHPSTKVMCAALSVAGTRIFWTEIPYDLKLPDGVIYEHGLEFLRSMVTDPSGCIIVAHNMEFERAIWNYTLKLPEPQQWYDTMDVTLSRGLPAGCDEAGKYLLKMEKDHEGKRYIATIWGPNKKTGIVPALTSYHIQRIINYNFRDVEISQGIASQEGYVMTPDWEQRVCDLHHKINFWGIRIDKEFAKTLRSFDDEFKAAAGEHVEELTGGSITRSDLTRSEFIMEQLNANLPADLHLDNMQEKTLEELVEECEGRDDVPWQLQEVIKCRMIATRAALAKVDKALDCISADGRAKAQLRYWGASTGRWSGYQVQPQNMKKPNEDFDLPAAIAAIERQDRDAVVALCKDKNGKTLPPYELLGSLVRGILVPEPGSVFVVGDFASIEARALLWLAGDEENLNEYRAKDRADEAHPDGKDPTVPDTYQSLAGSMFKVNPVEVSKKQRGGGKIGILACGFQGGANAVERMARSSNVDLEGAGLTPQDVVDGYRDKHPKVRAFWTDCESKFKYVLTTSRTTVGTVGRLKFERLPDRVLITLPSGRSLTYMNARMEDRRYNSSFGGQEIAYDNAVHGHTRRRTTYGGKIVENVVQAFCRDLLADVMLRLDAAGWPIAFHVHDEVVGEIVIPRADEYLEAMQQIMRTPPAWAEGMPVFSIPCTMARYGK